MSSILKALKKLEQEKTTRRPDSFRIDSEIVRGEDRSRPGISRATLASILLFLGGAGAMYLYMQPPRPPATKLATSTVSPGAPVSLPAPAGSPVAAPPVMPADADGRGSAKQSAVVSVDRPSKISRPDLRPAEIIPRPVATPVAPPSNVPAPVVTPAQATAAPKPVLKVLGIAYQEGTESAAVVNGAAVTKGSVIEGARVDEILKDHIRFSRGGEKFEVFLDRSN